MPICKREGFDINDGKNVTFHDNDLVFCCYITMRIFKDYEDYFRHVMVINSTVWQCEATGRDNLTYEEALKSERVARKKMEQFKHSLRAPVLLVIEHARQSAVTTLSSLVTKFLRKRYFFNEEVTVVGHKNKLFVVVGIKPGKQAAEPADGIYEDTDQLDYCLRVVNGDAKTEITVPFDKIRRQRTDFNVENLGMFIKNNVSRVDGILRPKSESFKQYVTDKGISFNSIFIGKMPHYAPAKSKRPNENAPENANKKQSTLNKYIVKGEEVSRKAKAKEAKSLAENMERMRLEKEAWLAEAARKKAEKKAQLAERVEAEIVYLQQKTDDLERKDQRLMPTFKPVLTFLQENLIGDAFMMREFLHTFCGLLSGIEVFRQNLSFYEMSRALSAREVAGPLSDILLVLLGTVFDLQKEEDEDSMVQYRLRYGLSMGTLPEPQLSMSHATRSHFYAKRHFSFRIYDLPLDALTLSEVLRLHLLGSGAFVDDKSERWRIMYRNGYSSREDPGLELRMRHSHILRYLKNFPIYQLGFRDIMRVIRCLMDQILTYSATLNVIEERMEQMATAKMELRTLLLTEHRRLAAVEQNKRRLTTEYHQKCLSDELKNDAAKKQALGDKLNKSIAELHAQSDFQQRKHEQQVLQMHTQLFNFLVHLGMDRCYRKYYVLESCPGIFIEHPPDSMDMCLEEPPLNKSQAEIHAQSQLPKNRKDLRFYLMKLYGEEDNKSRKGQPAKEQPGSNNLENKENQEHHLNGHAEPMNLDGEAESTAADSPTQYQLLMCTGDRHNCLVHNERDGHRQRWSYIYKPEEIDDLIKSLNPLGWRESQLLDEISNLRSLIAEHTKKCPADMLSLDTEKKRNSFVSSMYTETNRKYSEANFGLSEGTDLNEVMQLHLVDRILKFESDIYTGDLGQLKVKDMEKWRKNLLEGKYDAQCKLQWGPRGGKHEDSGGLMSETAASAAGSDNESHEDYLDDHENEEIYYGKFGKKPYRDPGIYLGPSLEIDSEDSADDEVPMLESDIIQVEVRNMASALLQVEQAIQRRFLKEPYGPSKRDTKQDMLKVCEARVQQWEVSLMESTSFAQVFLHLNLLHDCIHWHRSTNKSLCKVCRRGTDPEKMLLCDECNAGTHMFCMKPKMRTVPQGNWYCKACEKIKMPAIKKEKRKVVMQEEEELTLVEDEPEEEQEEGEEEEEGDEYQDTQSEASSSSSSSSSKLPVQVNGRSSRRVSERKRRLKSKEIEEAMENDYEDAAESVASKEEQEDEEVDEEQEEEAEDDKVCQVCFYDGSEIRCVRCSLHYHLECAQLKRPPRTDFVCKKCKTTESAPQRSRRRQSPDDDDNDEEPDEPQPKRSRSSRHSVRISLDKSSSSNNNNNDTSNKNNNNNNNNRRSGRRTNDNLPLNSSALYDLLEQTMKHKLAWPFLRPVLSSEVPDYHQIVKTPMDLAKVKSKLNMGEYQLNEELLNDIQLVFHNCDLYNVEGNEIYDAGSELERFVMARCRDMHLPFKPSNMNFKMIY